ncbi:MAG: RHS repeat domain-containing protein, partial [Dolichospermum sp.]
DTNGNLIKITDPDGTSRTWEYDPNHLMISEVDKRGNKEQTFYDFAGRADKAIRKDGSQLDFDPVQVQGLYAPNKTIDPVNAPLAFQLGNASSTYTDANGKKIVNNLDKAGQIVSSSDEVGLLPAVQRNEDNLVTQQTDARGNVTSFTYDVKGNLLTTQDSLSFGSEFIDISKTGQVLLGVQNADDVAVESDVPFAFKFYNNTYNRIGVSSNGLLSFGGTNSTYTNNDLSTGGGLGLPSILPFWDDLETRSDQGATAQVYTQTIGEPGNRKFIVQWHQVEAYSYTSQTGNITFEAILSEGTNAIQFNYLDVKFDGNTDQVHGSGKSATVGIWNNATQFQQYSFNQPSLRDGLSLIVNEQGITEATGTSIGRGFKSFTYDPTFNQLTSMTDELGHQTLYQIDPNNGNRLSFTQVVGAVGGNDDLVTQFTYTNNGLVDLITDPLGRITDSDYDAKGRLISIIYAKGTA